MNDLNSMIIDFIRSLLAQARTKAVAETVEKVREWAKSPIGAAGVMLDQRDRKWIDQADLLVFLSSLIPNQEEKWTP